VTESDRNTLFWHFPHYRHEPEPYSIIREGDWKLIKFWEGPKELYNLKEDLSEEYPQRIPGESMRRRKFSLSS